MVQQTPLAASVEAGQGWPAFGVHTQQPQWLLICGCTERELNSRWRHGLYSVLSSELPFQPAQVNTVSGQFVK